MFGKGKKKETVEIKTEEAKTTVLIDDTATGDLVSEIPTTTSVVTNEETVDNAPPPLGWRELKALRQNKYSDKSSKFDNAFVIKHKRTGMIVELRAASSVHACTLIGWRPKQVTLLKVKDFKDEKVAQEKLDGANVVMEDAKENCPALK
jgi:hypothetical protein